MCYRMLDPESCGGGSENKQCLQWLRLPSYLVVLNWRRKWQPIPVFLPGKFHGQRSLVGYSPWGRKESDTTERLHFFTSLNENSF